ncbi:MAG: bifunctional aspartate kinase/homoserine dehydrogenase I [Pseudomonadota bacterium]
MTGETTWQVHKFGGSSLADADCFRRVRDLITSEPSAARKAVVVSAMGGMTDALLALVEQAVTGDADFGDALDALESRYETAAGRLLDREARADILSQWTRDREDIAGLLQAVTVVRAAPERTFDVVAGYGEIWSARLLAALVAQDCNDGRRVGWLDARDVVVVRQTKLGPSVVWPESRERSASSPVLAGNDIVIVTGFIASDETGLQTTLGRNGSDHSAAIFAALLGADAVTIWTDVPGVLTGDPRQIPDAHAITSLSYNEAMELAYFGAKVIHPQTMGPAVEHDIPIRIRSTFAPDSPGTVVSAGADSDEPVKGITSIGGLAVVNVEGAGMIGVPGTAHRIFRALREAEISVILISQASSEHSVCIVVPDDVAETAATVVRDAFASELGTGQLQRVSITPECSILAVVGDRMSGRPGIAGRFLNTLGQAGINVIAIAQGSSERNISVVVASADATRALRAAHSGFYLSPKTLSIGLIGPGTVGGALLDQIAGEVTRLCERFSLDLRVRAIARSSVMHLAERAVDLSNWRELAAQATTPVDLAEFANHVDADHLPHAVIIDCTADDQIAEHYADWLARGIHVITPNKRAGSGPCDRVAAIEAAGRSGHSRFYYETTVGAALPIIRTLRDLVETGDQVRSVQGIFSGTLAYLFNTYDGSEPFSAIVRRARDAGFTEPDPRDDLSGTDVARKLVILARESGHAIELADVSVESLVPEALEGVGVEAFLDQVDVLDADMAQRLEAADAAGQVLRYVGRITADGQASVALTAVSRDDALANIALTDNVVRIESDRYSDNPLVIQGPGAGPDVTAAGVFADLLRLAAELGNRR